MRVHGLTLILEITVLPSVTGFGGADLIQIAVDWQVAFATTVTRITDTGILRFYKVNFMMPFDADQSSRPAVAAAVRLSWARAASAGTRCN